MRPLRSSEIRRESLRPNKIGTAHPEHIESRIGGSLKRILPDQKEHGNHCSCGDSLKNCGIKRCAADFADADWRTRRSALLVRQEVTRMAGRSYGSNIRMALGFRRLIQSRPRLQAYEMLL